MPTHSPSQATNGDRVGRGADQETIGDVKEESGTVRLIQHLQCWNGTRWFGGRGHTYPAGEAGEGRVPLAKLHSRNIGYRPGRVMHVSDLRDAKASVPKPAPLLTSDEVRRGEGRASRMDTREKGRGSGERGRPMDHLLTPRFLLPFRGFRSGGATPVDQPSL